MQYTELTKEILIWGYLLPVAILNISLIGYVYSDVFPLVRVKGHLIDFLKRYAIAVYVPIYNIVVLIWMVLFITSELIWYFKKRNQKST